MTDLIKLRMARATALLHLAVEELGPLAGADSPLCRTCAFTIQYACGSIERTVKLLALLTRPVEPLSTMKEEKLP